MTTVFMKRLLFFIYNSIHSYNVQLLDTISAVNFLDVIVLFGNQVGHLRKEGFRFQFNHAILLFAHHHEFSGQCLARKESKCPGDYRVTIPGIDEIQLNLRIEALE